MRTLTICLFVAALAACASTTGRRALRIDGTSQASFEKSVAAMQQELPPWRRLYLEVSLREIWNALAAGGPVASADETAAVYFAKLDGLAYDEVVDLGGVDARNKVNAIRIYQARYAQQSRIHSPSDHFGAPSDSGGFRGETMINTFGPYPGFDPPR